MVGFAVAVATFFWLFAHAGGAQAANKLTTVQLSHATVTRLSHGKTLPTNVKPDAGFIACNNMMEIPASGCSGPGGGDDNSPDATGVGAPTVANGLTSRGGSGGSVAGWNGLYDTQNTVANDDPNFELTPPDQGLCVGPASALEPLHLAVPGNSSVVVEPVNEEFAVYSDTGALLYGPDSLADLFSDPYATGDVSCNYDPATKSFFFTEIGGFESLWYVTDLVVMNANGYAAYGVDTSYEGDCFPDFPQHGFDNNAFYITVNEFCGLDEDFYGAGLWALSKSQLASLSPYVNYIYTDEPLTFPDYPVLTLRPAIGDGANTEYLLNSQVLDYYGDYEDYASNLGFWWISRDNNITSGVGPTYIYGEEIGSEPYAQPVPADSTGDGETPQGADPDIISEYQLNPDDNRLEQVQYSGGYLYSSLNTSLYFGEDGFVTPNQPEDPNDDGYWDGAAWFRVNTKTARVDRQGYVGADGTNLLYPSFGMSKHGTYFMDFSLTSPVWANEIDPSTAYTFSKNLGNTFAPITVTGEGSGPHVSFSDIDYNEPRWGDYSAMAFDPANGTVWMADEYVPPDDGNGGGGADLVDNWGTYVWGLTG